MLGGLLEGRKDASSPIEREWEGPIGGGAGSTSTVPVQRGWEVGGGGEQRRRGERGGEGRERREGREGREGIVL